MDGMLTFKILAISEPTKVTLPYTFTERPSTELSRMQCSNFLLALKGSRICKDGQTQTPL